MERLMQYSRVCLIDARVAQPCRALIEYVGVGVGGLMERFDVVLSISSVEHDGLGRYGDALDPDADLHAMRFLQRYTHTHTHTHRVHGDGDVGGSWGKACLEQPLMAYVAISPSSPPMTSSPLACIDEIQGSGLQAL